MNISFFSQFNVWQVFIYFISLLIFSLILHNKFKSWWIGVFLIITYIASSFLFVSSPIEWWFVVFGAIAYTVIDTIAVHLQMWKYNTSHGYALWAGPAWGILTILVHRMTSVATWPFILFTFVIAGMMIASRGKKALNFSWLNFIEVVLIILSALLFPKIFFISFGIGVLIEFLSVEVFGTWKYPEPNYLHLGLGYGILMSFIEALFSIAGGTFHMYYLAFLLGLFGFFISTFMPPLYKSLAVHLTRIRTQSNKI